eukprot:g6980.t1
MSMMETRKVPKTMKMTKGGENEGEDEIEEAGEIEEDEEEYDPAIGDI